MMTAIIISDGPRWIELLRLAKYMNTGLTMNVRNRMYPIEARITYNTVMPLLALTRATVKASNTHPVTSLPTPAESVMTPTEVCSNLSSVRIRARTGNAVIENATPIKRRNTPNEGCDVPEANVL